MATTLTPYQQELEKRRQGREVVNGQIRGAIQKRSQGGWDLRNRLNGQTGRPKNLGEAIRQAVVSARDLLNTFDFPSSPKVTYTGVKNIKQASEGNGIDDGIIMLIANFHTTAGVKNEIEIPVEVRNGEILQPSVFFHQGNMRIIAPSSIKDLVASGTFHQPQNSRGQYAGPLTPQESSSWYEQQGRGDSVYRINPGMYGKMASKDAVLPSMVRTAQIDSQTHSTGKCEKCGALLVKDPDTQKLDDTGRLWMCPTEGCDYKIPDDELKKMAQLGHQPSRGDMKMKATPASLIGDRVHTKITFDPDQTEQMSDGNLRSAIRSFIIELGSKKTWSDWGTVGDIQIETMDRSKGKAEASFKSSETSAPQLAPAQLKSASPVDSDTLWKSRAAVHTHTNPDGSYANYGATPTSTGKAMKDAWGGLDDDRAKTESKLGQTNINDNSMPVCDTCGSQMLYNHGWYCDKQGCSNYHSTPVSVYPPKAASKTAQSALDVSERNRADKISTGQTVKLDKVKTVKNRGGGTEELPVGSKGVVVSDVFGDGTHLKVKFEDFGDEITIPVSHLKTASRVAQGEGCPNCGKPLEFGPLMKGRGEGYFCANGQCQDFREPVIASKTAQSLYDCPDCTTPLSPTLASQDMDKAEYGCKRCDQVFTVKELKDLQKARWEAESNPEPEPKHAKAQSPEEMVTKIVAEIQDLRKQGYSAIDSVMRARSYGPMGDRALVIAKQKGYLKSEV